jgi:hypothetical protein
VLLLRAPTAHDGSLATNGTAAGAAGSKVLEAEGVEHGSDLCTEDALPPAPLVGGPEQVAGGPNGMGSSTFGDDDTDSEGEFEGRMAEECARMHGPSPQVCGVLRGIEPCQSRCLLGFLGVKVWGEECARMHGPSPQVCGG